MIIAVVQIINDSSDIFIKQTGTQLGITHSYLGIQPGQGIYSTILASIDIAVMTTTAFFVHEGPGINGFVGFSNSRLGISNTKTQVYQQRSVFHVLLRKFDLFMIFSIAYFFI